MSLGAKEWVTFFDLLDEVVNMEGTYAEKKWTVLNEMKKYGSQAELNLEEFLAWFEEEDFK